jgi:hypothetical protein
MRVRFSALSIAFVLGCAASAAHAESLYVIEQLFVTVNSASDGNGQRVGQIKSGDEVELLERQGDQAHVRLASGSDGWVKGSYLSADPPLREQVKARTAELEQTRKEKAQLEAELAKARAALTAANAATSAAAKAASKQPAAPAVTSPPASASPANTPVSPPATSDATIAANPAEPIAQSAPPLFQDEPLMPSRPSWLAAVGVALLTLAVGFALGWWMLDRRIRAKFGGLRIY